MTDTAFQNQFVKRPVMGGSPSRPARKGPIPVRAPVAKQTPGAAKRPDPMQLAQMLRVFAKAAGK